MHNIEHVLEKLKIERFCCCVSLKTGCYIIATLGWILTFLKVVFLVRGTVSSDAPNTYYDIEYRVCYIIIMFAACAALIYGTHKHKKIFLIPWLILKCLESTLMVVMTIIFFVLFFTADDFVNEHAVFMSIAFVAFLFGTGLSWYFWVCVWNFFHTLSDVNPNAVAPQDVLDEYDKESHMA